MIVCLIAGVCICACTADTLPEETEDKEELLLQIQPSVSDEPATRTPVVTFNNKNDIAMFIFPNGKYSNDAGIDGSEEYKPIPEYSRIITKYASTTAWQYTLNDNIQTPNLYLKRNAGAVDLFAYYPYIATQKATRLDQILFKIGTTMSTNYDYMVPDAQDGKYTVDPKKYEGVIDNVTGKPTKYCELPIAFHHIMSQLEFKFTPSFWGQDLYPNFQLKCTTQGGQPANVIGMEGNYSCLNGIVTPTKYVSELKYTGQDIPIRTSENLQPSTQGFVLPSIELDKDAEDIIMSITISFNLAGPQPIQTVPFEIHLKSFAITDETGKIRYGLLPGYKCTIAVKIDNFVKYTGKPVMVKWTEEETEIPI